MRNSQKEQTQSNVVSKCYVILFMSAGLVKVEPTIYLEYPEYVSSNDEVHEFKNVFAAKRFIQEHVQPGTRVAVAA
jgi:hypothetical protein